MHHVNYDLKDSYFRWKTKRQNSNQFFSATEVKELKYGVELEGILKKKKKKDPNFHAAKNKPSAKNLNVLLLLSSRLAT